MAVRRGWRSSLLLVFLAVLLLPLDVASATAPPRDPPPADQDGWREGRSGRVAVRFKSGVGRAARDDVVRGLGATRRSDRAQLRVAVLDVAHPAQALERARRDPRVEWAEREVFYRPFADIRGPERDETKIDLAWDEAAADGGELRGAGVTVGVLDSGVDPDNPDLVGRVLDGGDYTGGWYQWDSPPDGALDPSDPHGTAVAALIAAAEDGQGIVGYAPEAQIAAYKVIGADGFISSFALADAIVKASYVDGVPILNLSLGGPFESLIVREAVDIATEYGTTVVAAAGNDGSEQPMFPAGTRNVLSVGASERGSDGSWRVTGWSNRGDVDVLAPGARVRTWWGSEINRIDGTSFAAPQVAGILAGLASEQVVRERARALLVATAAPANPAAGIPPSASGVGRVDALAAWRLAHANTAFSAVFVDNGTSVSRKGGRRDIEVLRYSPLDGDTTVPDVTASSTSVDLRLSGIVTSELAPTPPPGGGTMLRVLGRFTVDRTAEVGTTWKLRVSGDGEPTVRRPVLVTLPGNGPDGMKAQPRTTRRRTVEFGTASGFVRRIAAYEGDLVKIDFRMPKGVDPMFDPVLLGVWFPRDTDGDGGVEIRQDRPPLASHEADLVYDGSQGREGRVAFEAPHTGYYTIGYRTFAPGADGTYRLGLRVPTSTATMHAPSIATKGTKVHRLSFRVRWRADRRPARIATYQVQWSPRKRDGDGGWEWGRWRTLDRFASDGSGSGRTAFGDPDDVRVKQGKRYRFRVRPIDGVGNRGKWSRVDRTDVPLDDTHRRLDYRGRHWEAPDCPARRDRKCFGRTLHDTDHRRSATYRVEVTARTKRFAIVAKPCRRCASYDVYVDGQFETTVDLRGKGWAKVVWRSGKLSKRPTKHTLELVARTTSQRWRVTLDGIALRR